MKNRFSILIILIPIFAFALGIGAYYLSLDFMISRNIEKMDYENDLFYQILEEEQIDVRDYVLYDEVFIENGKYYIIFTETATGLIAEGDFVSGILLEIETEIYTEYSSSISWEKDAEVYVLPYLWIAGGGSAYASSLSFYKKAELRRLIVENNINIIEHEITIRISGSYCLGKLEIE